MLQPEAVNAISTSLLDIVSRDMKRSTLSVFSDQVMSGVDGNSRTTHEVEVTDAKLQGEAGRLLEARDRPAGSVLCPELGL